MVTAPPLLKYYEREKDLVIQCDASEGGLGAALLQDGKPLAYASRALTAAERNYAQIERSSSQLCFPQRGFTSTRMGDRLLSSQTISP